MTDEVRQAYRAKVARDCLRRLHKSDADYRWQEVDSRTEDLYALESNKERTFLGRFVWSADYTTMVRVLYLLMEYRNGGTNTLPDYEHSVHPSEQQAQAEAIKRAAHVYGAFYVLKIYKSIQV